MTGGVALGILLAHLVGDYLCQSHWMATEKTRRWWPAIAHGVTYTLPFLIVTRSPAALVVICLTHIVIDRYRLARYVVWAKNQLGAKRTYVWRTKPKEGDPLAGREWAYGWSAADSAAMRPIHAQMSVAPPWADRIRTDPLAGPPTATGYPPDTPPWLATWLLIIADNTLHLLIAFTAVWWLV